MLAYLAGRLRSMLTRRRRRWTRDDVWALASWLFVGQGLFILVGTTTFASLMLLLANSLQFQDWMARRLARYLAKETGLEFTFGETIMPNWRAGKISFKDVSVKSIGQDQRSPEKHPPEQATTPDPSPPPITHALYNLTIERADVTLSMRRLLEGKGLLDSCEVQGVRGTVDRRHVDPEGNPHWRHTPQRGDLDLQHLLVKDLLVTFLNPDGFRPYTLSLISAEFPRMRKRFILHDFLAAESVVGMLDGSLFSMHIPQVKLDSEGRGRCDRMRHLKMHALNVDFFARGATMGPLSWLTRGSVDVDVFIQLPPPADPGASLGSKIGALTEGILVQVLRQSQSFIEGRPGSGAPALEPPLDEEYPFSLSTISGVLLVDFERLRQVIGGASRQLFGPFLGRLRSRISEDILNVDDRALESPEEAALHFLNPRPDAITFKVDFRFHNLRAHLPWTHSGAGGLLGTNLMVRPLVAYLNEQRPFIPISCHFTLPLGNFDGAWSMYEAGIFEALSRGAAESFESLVSDRQKKMRRLKRISLWSLYAIFRNLRGVLPDFYHVAASASATAAAP